MWAWILLVGVLGLGLSGGSLFAARRSMAAPRRWRSVLEQPEEVELVVQSTTLLDGGASYALAVPGQQTPIVRTIPRPQEEPLFLDLARSRVLGLRNPKQPGAVMVVRCDLAPLDLDPALATEVCARAREAAKNARREA